MRVHQAAGGTTAITSAVIDIRSQTLSFRGAGDINVGGAVSNSSSGGQLVVGVNGTAGGPTVTLSNANTYNGQTFVRAGTLAFTWAGAAGAAALSGSGNRIALIVTAVGAVLVSVFIARVATRAIRRAGVDE